MTWSSVKELDADTKTWGMRKRLFDTCDNEDFKRGAKVFESILNRCGQFLKQICFYRDDFCAMDAPTMDMIAKKCPKAYIDIDIQFFYKETVKILQPVSSIIRRLYCKLRREEINDKVLKGLFSKTKNLEILDLCVHDGNVIGTFLNSLPRGTIKELLLFEGMVAMPLDRIFRVSISFLLVSICKNHRIILFYNKTTGSTTIRKYRNIESKHDEH